LLLHGLGNFLRICKMIYTYSMQKDLAEVKALLSTVPLLSALGEEELLSLAGGLVRKACKARRSANAASALFPTAHSSF